jgi:hypothetical protein
MSILKSLKRFFNFVVKFFIHDLGLLQWQSKTSELMTQAQTKQVTFEEFAAWRPENGRYELHNGVIVEMAQPLGGHEKVTGFLSRKVTV